MQWARPGLYQGTARCQRPEPNQAGIQGDNGIPLDPWMHLELLEILNLFINISKYCVMQWKYMYNNN